MSRAFYLLLPLLLTPAVSAAQRYGRPYNLAENPQLLLQIKVQNHSSYFHPADLRKMQRSSLTLTSPTAKDSHIYEGVVLEQLTPGRPFGSAVESIEIQFGARQTIRISGADLDSASKPMVIDTVDGKQLSGYAPYSVMVKLRGKPEETIADVKCIIIRSS